MTTKEVEQLQDQIRKNFSENRSFLALKDSTGHSNTTRSPSYKSGCLKLDCTRLNRILQLDTQTCLAKVEPRVTMGNLVKATLAQGFIPPVIPEFKGITLGGAIMGGAAESASHRYGIFHDTCSAIELLLGDGSLLRASPDENPDIFYGIASSYGSLGMLVGAEIQLVPAKQFVRLHYHFFSDPQKALQALSARYQESDFLDAIVFTPHSSVVIEGFFEEKPSAPLSRFSLSAPFSSWYYQHAQRAPAKESMPTYDYLFRYDQGAFWMGGYVCKPSLLVRLITEGIWKLFNPAKGHFNEKQIKHFHRVMPPSRTLRAIFHRFLNSQNLWKIEHLAEKWIQDRFVIQDFCIPVSQSAGFLDKVLADPGIFPIWLCPIKGAQTPQIFSPHVLSQSSQDRYFINFGLYGIPSYSAPLDQITHQLEARTAAHGGRKVLYSRSCYTEEEFWTIYSQGQYRALRKKAAAEGIWLDITEKVLSQ